MKYYVAYCVLRAAEGKETEDKLIDVCSSEADATAYAKQLNASASVFEDPEDPK